MNRSRRLPSAIRTSAVVFGTLAGAICLPKWILSQTLEQAGISQRSAELQMDQSRIDVGNVAGGKLIETWIEMRNCGDRRLIISRDPKRCACVAGEESQPIIISPRGSTRIPIKLIAPQPEGAFSESVSFQSNDPNHPTVWVSVSGLVTSVR
jgi:hypothetical protein